jgi:hypothetical protein
MEEYKKYIEIGRGVDSITLAQVRDKWRAFLSKETKLSVP